MSFLQRFYGILDPFLPEISFPSIAIYHQIFHFQIFQILIMKNDVRPLKDSTTIKTGASQNPLQNQIKAFKIFRTLFK